MNRKEILPFRVKITQTKPVFFDNRVCDVQTKSQAVARSFRRAIERA